MKKQILEIIECTKKPLTHEGDITFIQRDDILLRQFKKVGDVAKLFWDFRNPEIESSFNLKVITHGSGSESCAFGLATEPQSASSDKDLANPIIELKMMFVLLSSTLAGDARSIVTSLFPGLQDESLVEQLVSAREGFIGLVGGKKVDADFLVFVAGEKVAEFRTKFPSKPILEPDLTPKKLTGEIVLLGNDMMEFIDLDLGRIVIDFSPAVHFYLLRARFQYPKCLLELTVDWDEQAKRAALTSIESPPVGSYENEFTQLGLYN